MELYPRAAIPRAAMERALKVQVVILRALAKKITWLVEEESTYTVMAGLRTVIEKHGIFCALYSDRGSHFFHTPKAGEKVGERLTQAGRAFQQMGIRMIPAYSLCERKLKPKGHVHHLHFTSCPSNLIGENYVFLACA